MRVFADTSGLFALLVRNDNCHADARDAFTGMVERGVVFCTTNYVLLETSALLQSRVGLKAARRFQHEFVPLLEIAWVDAPLHAKAFRRLELRDRRNLSLVDCVSFVWMEETGVRHAFAYDRHFSAENVSLLSTLDEVRRHCSAPQAAS